VSAQPGIQSQDPPGAAPLQRLLPPGGSVSAAQMPEEWGLWERAQPTGTAAPPRVLLNMVASLDARASLHGRSAALSGPADRQLFHALRAASDAILVGAGTVRAERYGPLIREPATRALRRERGLCEQPLACIVSSSLQLAPDLPLLADPDSHVVIITGAEGRLAGARARVDYVRRSRDGGLDLNGALGELAARFSVQSLLCEGGPHLATALLAAGIVDELFLSLSPTLVGGPEQGGEQRVLAPVEFSAALELELASVLAGGSELFLRYRAPAPEEVVSRETTSKSSLAS